MSVNVGNFTTLTSPHSILSNATVISSGHQNVFGNFTSLVFTITVLSISVGATLQFTVQDLDPGNQTTFVGSNASSVSITSAGSYTLTLNPSYSNIAQLNWSISGLNAKVSGVYVSVYPTGRSVASTTQQIIKKNEVIPTTNTCTISTRFVNSAVSVFFNLPRVTSTLQTSVVAIDATGKVLNSSIASSLTTDLNVPILTFNSGGYSHFRVTYTYTHLAFNPNPVIGFVTALVKNFYTVEETLGGDLSGTYPDPTVIAIQGNAIQAQPLGVSQDQYVLTWVNADQRWEALPASGGGGGFTAGGDLSGSSVSQTVAKLQGSILSSPAGGANKVLHGDSAGTLNWSQVSLSSDVVGTLPTGNQAAQSLGGDLSGTTSSGTVIKLQGRTVASTAPGINQVLGWNNGSSQWEPTSVSLTGSAGGDLSGTYPNPTVAKINGTSVPATPSVNQVLVATGSTTSVWQQIVNAQVDPAAAIAYSKLSLTGSIVNADINASAAIVYSKLNLTGGIINADVSNSAAIAYSKLALTNSIVNADINASAAVAVSKLASGTAGQFLVNTSAPTPTWTTISGDVSASVSTAGLLTVTGIQSNPVSSVSPLDGYVLVWDATDGYWKPEPPEAVAVQGVILSFANFSSDISTYDQLTRLAIGAEGDLTAAVTSGGGQVLIKQFATNIGTPNITYIPAGQWTFDYYTYVSSNAGITQLVFKVYTRTSGGSETLLFTAVGDHITETSVTEHTVTFNYPNDTNVLEDDRIVVKVYAQTTSGSSITTHFVFDGSAHASHIHTPILGAAIQVGGDLSGTTGAATVIKIQGNAVTAQTLNSSTDGYVLTWDNADGYWKALPDTDIDTGITQLTGDVLAGPGSGSQAATVVQIRGKSLNASLATIGATQDGYALTWDNTDGYWKALPSSGGGAPTGAAGGDLSGTYPNPTVAKIDGASVPAAGSLTTGNVLQVSGASALTYGAINLAGGANYVTGILPAANCGVSNGAPASPPAKLGSCILRWLCNDAAGSGTIVNDGSVGAGANLTVQNAGQVVQGESGLYCDACDFIPNGATGGWAKSANNVGNPSSTTLLTLHGWVKPLGTQQSFGRIITKLYNATGVTPFDAVCILFNSTTNQISAQWTSGAASKTATSLVARNALQINIWQYVAVTFSQASTTMTVNFYINGDLISTQAVTSGAFDWNVGSAGPWAVGGCSFTGTLSGETFNGHLTDWRVEDGAALSLATIRANYKYGAGLNY